MLHFSKHPQTDQLYLKLMLRKVLIILGVLALLLLVARFGMFYYTKQFSPAAIIETKANGLDVKIEYSQPSKKGRLIFGSETQKALVPYGRVWRTGANEATILKIQKDVTFAGKPLKAGEYTLWTIPNATNWTVIINAETGQWGTEYDPKRDLFRTEVSSTVKPDEAEMFSISFADQTGGVDMLLHWDRTEVIVPIRVQ